MTRFLPFFFRHLAPTFHETFQLTPLPLNKVTPTPSPTSSTKPSSETKHGRISVKRALVEMLVWTSLESLGTLFGRNILIFIRDRLDRGSLDRNFLLFCPCVKVTLLWRYADTWKEAFDAGAIIPSIPAWLKSFLPHFSSCPHRVPVPIYFLMGQKWLNPGSVFLFRNLLCSYRCKTDSWKKAFQTYPKLSFDSKNPGKKKTFSFGMDFWPENGFRPKTRGLMIVAKSLSCFARKLLW